MIQLGNMTVRVPPDWNPEAPGAPIHHVNGRAHAGNTVYRTPNTIVREGEPGANWPGDLSQMMFLPDGRLVPASPAAFDMMRGAPEVIGERVMVTSTGSVVRTLVSAGAMFAGGAVGYKLSSKHRALGTVGGAVVGGILGLIFR